jgi:AcrR family transcriptional regulator
MKNNPNRSLILNSARKNFYQRGFNNTSIRAIAAEVNMTNVNLFNYFKNKREILVSLFDDFLDSMYFPLNSIIPGLDHPVEAMLSGIIIFQYTLSYNKRFSDLYEEALKEDVIGGIFVRNLTPFCQQIVDSYSHEKFTKKELHYTVYTLFEAIMNINVRVSKEELNFSQDFLRNQHIRLFYRLFYLNREDFQNEEKTILKIAKEYDYRSVSTYWTTEWIEFDDSKKIINT